MSHRRHLLCRSAWLLLAGLGLLGAIRSAAADSAAPESADKARQHWSLQPLTRPPIPHVVGAGTVPTNPIDAFIRAKLAAQQLAPAPEADRRTLFRRLSFDLLGLPPTPEESDTFERDTRPDAYERTVDRLLASPRHGERWARHWLDVVRYTESQGFEYDRLREHAWPYRDYVIRSFNADKPYDRFMREQLAGDAIEPVTSEGIIAASLLVSGPWDQAGNSQANLTQRAITREEEMEDLVSVVGQTFLGLTVNCARCHDHKFDPITLMDYYRVKAVFDGVKHGDRFLEGTNGRVAYAGKREQPTPTKALKRGDVKSPGEVVAAAGLSAITAVKADFGLAPDAPEAERRLKFAGWLADARNPLPARVMVNRVWQFHFGQGLVATPSDFGASGAKPSHPELLDWLASEFIASGWSVKALHRLIVTSATYRQASAIGDWELEIRNSQDADNTLLWRFPPRRLEAEAVRDAMLAVSGDLNLQLGGPSFRPFTTTEFNATFYHPFDKGDPEFNRRTVYRMNVNSGKEPLLDAFDCPDPSVKTPRRGVTTTPLQALGLMNSTFVQRQADRLAERALRLAGNDLSQAVGTAYRIALGRPATEPERQQGVAAARERGMANVCWVLLNSTEFVYVR